MLIQVMGLITGIVIVRLLPVKEYAWFTLANSMLGALSVLSDGGISSGVMAEAAKDWQNKEHVGKVLATGLHMRHRFAIYSMTFTLPLLAYLLLDNGAAWWQVLFVIISLVPSFYAALSDALLEIPVKLHQNIGALQRNQLFAAICRLIFTIIATFLFPFTAIALVVNGVSRIWANRKLAKMTKLYISSLIIPDQKIRNNIWAIVKKTLPGSFYFVFSGQVSMWIISFAGNTQAVAQIGALGRITIIFGVMGSVIGAIITPRFARLLSLRSLLRKRFLQIQVALLVFCIFLVVLVSFISSELLWILGDSYKRFESELSLNVIANLLGLMAGVSYGLTMSKGWVLNPLIAIPFLVSTMIVSAFCFDMETLCGVLKFSIIQALAAYILQAGFGIWRIQKERES